MWETSCAIWLVFLEPHRVFEPGYQKKQMRESGKRKILIMIYCGTNNREIELPCSWPTWLFFFLSNTIPNYKCSHAGSCRLTLGLGDTTGQLAWILFSEGQAVYVSEEHTVKAQNTCSPPLTHFGIRRKELLEINTLFQEIYIGRNSPYITHNNPYLGKCLNYNNCYFWELVQVHVHIVKFKYMFCLPWTLCKSLSLVA